MDTVIFILNTTMINYRRLWEKVNGSIPLDDKDRKYEIHHIDGDRKNNDISNLVCISIEEHFKIHYDQKDWGAAYRIAQRMDIDPKIKSELMSKSNKKRLEEGSHPFMDSECRERAHKAVAKKLANNEHPFQNPEIIRKAVIAKQNKYSHQELSDQTKKGWEAWKNKNPNADRTTKGSVAGAGKTRGTKWYHKPDGSQLRTTPEDLRIIEGGWIEGRFKGKELSIKANYCKLNKNKNKK
jgi:hypothetical protein